MKLEEKVRYAVNNYPQLDISKKTGIPTQTISKYSKGIAKLENMTLEKAQQIGDYYDLKNVYDRISTLQNEEASDEEMQEAIAGVYEFMGDLTGDTFHFAQRIFAENYPLTSLYIQKKGADFSNGKQNIVTFVFENGNLKLEAESEHDVSLKAFWNGVEIDAFSDVRLLENLVAKTGGELKGSFK